MELRAPRDEESIRLQKELDAAREIVRAAKIMFPEYDVVTAVQKYKKLQLKS